MPAGRARRRNPVCLGGIAEGDSEDVAGTARDAPRDVRAFLESMSDSARADRSRGPARSEDTDWDDRVRDRVPDRVSCRLWGLSSKLDPECAP